MNTHTALAVREGRWWIITVPEVDGVTQARRLSDVPQMAAELIAVTRDIPVADVRTDGIDVIVTDVDGVQVAHDLQTIHELRSSAAHLEQEASMLARSLARNLAAHDVPLRDVGAILGVSHQRAHQLVTTD